jgi:hypothetical protein
VFLFVLEVEPARLTHYHPQGMPVAHAIALVNHHDHDEAQRLARVALADREWLVRLVARAHLLSGDQIQRADESMKALMERATQSGVAIELGAGGGLRDADEPRPSNN